MPGIGPILARGEVGYPGAKLNLIMKFKDGMGNLIDVDDSGLPQVSILEPSGHAIMPLTSLGVGHVSTGIYNYLFDVPINPQAGIWSDVWVGYVNSTRVEGFGNFQIDFTQTPGHIHSDGYKQIGDPVGFNYSQIAIENINRCLELLKSYLNSSGTTKVDSPQGTQYISCDIFSTKILTHFLIMSLSKFNSIPFFTYFQWDDVNFFLQFIEIIVEGAALIAKASQSLIERGREFQLTDNGINFNPPAMSELLNTQYNTELAHHFEVVKMIKASMRPMPLNLGTFNAQNGGLNPAFTRLRHLRSRQIL